MRIRDEVLRRDEVQESIFVASVSDVVMDCWRHSKFDKLLRVTLQVHFYLVGKIQREC